MTKLNKGQKNILIGGLIAVVLVMTIAYAAFASQLNITGTGNITSNWNIHFDKTKIATTDGVIVATKATGATTEPTGTLTYTGDLSVTLTPTLINPGDTVEFNLTVVNDGDIDAMLETINMPASTNPAIKFTRSGMEEGTKLPAHSSKTFTVTVEYDSSVTSQPESTTADISATLTFVQDDGSSVEPTLNVAYRWTTDTLSIGDSIEGISTTTDPSTLGKDFFLKHILNEDRTIASSEVCFIKDNQTYCLKPNEYETSKANLLSIFGESACIVGDSYVTCSAGSLDANANSDGGVYAGDDSSACLVHADGSLYCYA